MKMFRFYPEERIEWPKYGSTHAAGLDLRSRLLVGINPGETATFDTGIGFEIDTGWFGKICPRSGMNKRGILCIEGIIDSDYRGSVLLMLKNMSPVEQLIQPNDRIAQIIFIPCWSGNIEMTTLDAVSETERGAGGFGSTGK